MNKSFSFPSPAVPTVQLLKIELLASPANPPALGPEIIPL